METAHGSVRVLYFARLREAFGTSGETMDLAPGLCTVADLRERLALRGGVWAEELAGSRVVRFAVNQTLCPPAHALSAGDEIAVFPPVTGG
ncbi:MAG: molybdopterin converting factor subunit 1 [Pseudomonadota bacterium]|jgi:molybdopterin synthase sulfur carrier subunit